MAEGDTTLRQLLASFVVEVDKAGNLAKGNTAVDGLKRKLEELTAAAAPAGKALDSVWEKVARNASASVAAMKAVDAARALSGGGSGDGFAAAGLAARERNAPQLGPTRGTLDAYRGTFGGRINRTLLPISEPFRAGFKESSGLSGAIGGLATLRNGILALGAGAAVHALTGLVDRIGDISESAARLGVTVEEFQRLDVLAKQNGTSVGALGTAFRTLANAAVDPTKETAAAFAKLDISTKDAAGGFKSRQDLFFETAGALADIGDGTERAALAQKLFGRGATELLPLLAGGRAGLEAQRDALMQLPVFTEAAVKAADELSDSWKTLGPQLLAAAGPLITKLLIPGLKLVTELLLRMSKYVATVSAKLDPLNILIAAGAVKLTLMASNAIKASGSLLKLAGSGAKAALQFAGLALAFLAIEDFIGFMQGKDSVFGDIFEGLLGPGGADGMRKAFEDVGTALKAMWDALIGNGQGESARTLYRDLSDFVSFIANDLLAIVGIGKGGANGPFETGGDSHKLLDAGKALLQAGAGDVGGAVISAGAALGIGGGSAQAPNNVTVGDQTIIVNGVNPNNASAVAGAVRGELGRDRASLMVPYITGGPI